AYVAPVSRTSGDSAVASIVALPLGPGVALTLTEGGAWQTTNEALIFSPVSASPGGLSGASLATTFTRYTPDGVVVVSHSNSVFSSSSSSSTQAFQPSFFA